MLTSLRRAGADFGQGLQMPVTGVRLLLRGENLPRLALIPAALALFATAGWLAAGYHWGQAILGSVWSKPAVCADCSWYERGWSNIELVSWTTAWIAGVLVSAAVVGVIVARVVIAFAMEELARRLLVDLGVATTPLYLGERLFRLTLRALGRVSVFILGEALLLLVSLIPAFVPFASVASLVWAGLWLVADTCTYPLRWQGRSTVRELSSLAWRRPWLTLGFALPTCALLMIPLVGVIATPLAVSSACAYAAAADTRWDQPRSAGAT